MLLADMGAEVVKVETPGSGDPIRRQGAIRDGVSWYFAGFNRNKRSLTLNLRHEEGRAALARLIARSDVLVENFRPGVLAAMGFDAARRDALNPNLVYCNISGFGSSGPYRDRPSFDFVAQAMSGFMSVTGEADGRPMRACPPIADLIAGLQGALGICAALVGRGRSGQGETVGASLNNAMISVLGFIAANHLATGETTARTGNDHAIVSPYGLFRTKDGEVAIAPSQEESYQRLLDALELAELRDRPEFPTNDLRVANRDAVNACVEAAAARGHERALDRLAERRRRALRPGEEPRRGLRRPAGHRTGDGGERRTSGAWRGRGCWASRSNSSDAPCRLRSPAPDLGADTDAVLEEIGYTAGRDRPIARARRGLRRPGGHLDGPAARSPVARRHPDDPAPHRAGDSALAAAHRRVGGAGRAGRPLRL